MSVAQTNQLCVDFQGEHIEAMITASDILAVIHLHGFHTSHGFLASELSILHRDTGKVDLIQFTQARSKPRNLLLVVIWLSPCEVISTI